MSYTDIGTGSSGGNPTLAPSAADQLIAIQAAIVTLTAGIAQVDTLQAAINVVQTAVTALESDVAGIPAIQTALNAVQTAVNSLTTEIAPLPALETTVAALQTALSALVTEIAPLPALETAFAVLNALPLYIFTSGVPAAGLGVNGQYALDISAGLRYGPKAAGVWPSTTAAITATIDPATSTALSAFTGTEVALYNPTGVVGATSVKGSSSQLAQFTGMGAKAFQTPGLPTGSVVRDLNSKGGDLLSVYDWLGDAVVNSPGNDYFTKLNQFFAYCQANYRTAYFPARSVSIRTETPNLTPCQFIFCEHSLRAHVAFYAKNCNTLGIPVTTVSGSTVWDTTRDCESVINWSTIQNCEVENMYLQVFSANSGASQTDWSKENLIANGLMVLAGAGRDVTNGGAVIDLDLSNPTITPDYYKTFAPGHCCYKTQNHATVRFSNCFGDGGKFAGVWDSMDGHIYTVRNQMKAGLAQIYYKKNSEDYLSTQGGGGGAGNGAFANYFIGTELWANHNGGVAVAHVRDHTGFGAYEYFQVDNNYLNPSITPSGTVSNAADPMSGGVYSYAASVGGITIDRNSSTTEQIGEARWRLSYNSLSTVNLGKDPSVVSATSTAYYLPDNMFPSGAIKRKYQFYLGDLAMWQDMSPDNFQVMPVSSGTAKVASIRTLFGSMRASNSDISRMQGNLGLVDVGVYATNAPSPGFAYSPTDPRDTSAKKWDLANRQAICSVGNLFNLAAATASVGTLTLTTLAAEGLDATWTDDLFIKICGTNPVVYKITPTAADGKAELAIPLAAAYLNVARPLEQLHRYMFMGFKRAAASSSTVSASLHGYASPQTFPSTDTFVSNRFQAFLNVGVKDTRTQYTSYNNASNCDVLYIVCPMMSMDRLEPFNPSAGPWVDKTQFPTAAPSVAGSLWNNNGVLTIV